MLGIRWVLLTRDHLGVSGADFPNRRIRVLRETTLRVGAEKGERFLTAKGLPKVFQPDRRRAA